MQQVEREVSSAFTPKASILKLSLAAFVGFDHRDFYHSLLIIWNNSINSHMYWSKIMNVSVLKLDNA